MDDDLDPRARLAPARALDTLSIEDLNDYAERLRRELETVRETIAAKRAHSQAADTLFKE
jgi:uncharacterized small protein (DUF1192 family)